MNKSGCYTGQLGRCEGASDTTQIVNTRHSINILMDKCIYVYVIIESMKTSLEDIDPVRMINKGLHWGNVEELALDWEKRDWSLLFV